MHVPMPPMHSNTHSSMVRGRRRVAPGGQGVLTRAGLQGQLRELKRSRASVLMHCAPAAQHGERAPQEYGRSRETHPM
eukprot:scaffold192053_cov17-Tisochrysis_lutea.AAC.1